MMYSIKAQELVTNGVLTQGEMDQLVEGLKCSLHHLSKSGFKTNFEDGGGNDEVTFVDLVNEKTVQVLREVGNTHRLSLAQMIPHYELYLSQMNAFIGMEDDPNFRKVPLDKVDALAECLELLVMGKWATLIVALSAVPAIYIRNRPDALRISFDQAIRTAYRLTGSLDIHEPSVKTIGNQFNKRS